MYRKKALTLAVTTLTSLNAPNLNAKTQHDRVDVLEARVHDLESKLEKALHALEAASAKQTTAAAAAPVPDIKKIDQKVKLIERKLEVDKEVSDGKWAKLPNVEVGTQGLNVESKDGNFKLNFRGLVQADGYYFVDDEDPNNVNGDGLVNRFIMRRVRPIFSGTLWKDIDWRIMPDFGMGAARLFDAYADLRYFRSASLAAGKFKAPISLERLQSASALTFLERGFPTQLAPNRDIGAMLHGEFDGPWETESTRSYNLYQFPEFLAYQVGIFDGTVNNGNIDSPTTDGKQVEARIFAHPFKGAGLDAVEGLGVGIGGSWGHPNDSATPTYATAGQQTMFKYASAARIDGTQYRIYPQVYWYWGPFGLIGEYAFSQAGVANQSTVNTGTGPHTVTKYSTIENDYAWNVTASYVLTGEDNTFQGVRPRHAFNPFEGKWGAWQAAARWTEIAFDSDVFRNVAKPGSSTPIYAFADPRQAVRNATNWSIGINWWLNQNVKIMADYNQTSFQGGGGVYDSKGTLTNDVVDRATEKVFDTRIQVSF
ncbi:OprO/OprP family phosphate-selective porin [Methylococcus capsulatus]|jgi:phosphate-selective porin OprO/OprP|uniref:Phosphate-selective porin OprO and OprP n=1 Tax=Methylococcus capsulatus TaxID=414 RepID=A0AA35XZC6_METCP|nr:porin [Methylococcus capsulatus]CAI8738019.1 phosphate-selective porin OprO and OprP [Methylococcus capsulatus]